MIRNAVYPLLCSNRIMVVLLLSTLLLSLSLIEMSPIRTPPQELSKRTSIMQRLLEACPPEVSRSMCHHHLMSFWVRILLQKSAEDLQTAS
uniref:Uncharacterized protein n=1 Tax=Magallana gigas TaxID=29159 RepID=K1R5D6_MAGGI